MRMKLVWTALLFAGIARAQEMEMQVELMNRVGTEFSRKGDLVSARIVSPAGFQGSTVEGKITECTSGSKSKGKSVIDIDFDMLRFNNSVTPINSHVKSIINSKGQANVDEEGRSIGASSAQQKKSSGSSGWGRALGGLASGRGAQIGDVVDKAASAVTVSSDAPNLRFDPGAKLLIVASTRSGPSLASLASASPETAQQTPAATGAQAAAASSPAGSSQPASAAPQTAGGSQPNFVAIKAEFVPGEKELFFDDFSDMSGDDAPPHWKIRGATPELRVAGSTRELALIGDRYDIYPNITGLPKNFTMEMDLLCEKDAGNVGGCGGINWLFHDKSGKTELIRIWISLDRATEDKKMIEYRLGLWDDKEALGQKTLTTNWKQLVKLAMWVQNGRLRFYVNGDRVFDFNQVDVGDIASLQMNFWTGDATMAFRRVRFAESAPDFSQTIASTGKFVTHGILFDTDSDRITADSAAVLQQIAKGLQASSDLKVEIDGHTDSTGAADHNLDLSKRRAAAVKNVLVSQFSIDADRLTTQGFGATKPIEPNTTAAGKANNRRVEFVRK